MPKLDFDTIPQANTTGYPDPFDKAVSGRWFRRLAPPGGLTAMGVSHVVLKPGTAADAAMIERLQAHVKATIAPFKYPRSVRFLDQLPKTPTGKIQRFRLRPKAGA